MHVYPLDINEEKVVAAAEQFIALGLRNAGYEYINIDVSRDSSGFDLVMLNFNRIVGRNENETPLVILFQTMKSFLMEFLVLRRRSTI